MGHSFWGDLAFLAQEGVTELLDSFPQLPIIKLELLTFLLHLLAILSLSQSLLKLIDLILKAIDLLLVES